MEPELENNRHTAKWYKKDILYTSSIIQLGYCCELLSANMAGGPPLYKFRGTNKTENVPTV